MRAAGVTRGALYHQFADKTELFAAVFESGRRGSWMERIGAAVGAVGTKPPRSPPCGSARVAWFEACYRRLRSAGSR